MYDASMALIQMYMYEGSYKLNYTISKKKIVIILSLGIKALINCYSTNFLAANSIYTK